MEVSYNGVTVALNHPFWRYPYLRTPPYGHHMGKLKSSNVAGYLGVSTMKLAASEQESLVESLNLLQALMILMLRESVGRGGFNMFQLLSL